MSDIRKKLLEIPKTEIHLHLEGLASVETIWALKKKHKIEFSGINSIEDLKEAFKVTSLDAFIKLFIEVIQVAFQEEDDIKFLIEDARNYLERNNIQYAEIFFAPSKFVQMGLSFSKIVKILDDGAKKIYKENNRSIKFLIDVSRTFGKENAMKNLDLVLQNRKSSIIGIGLGGAEKKGAASEYKEVFAKAISNDLKVVAHAGEDVGPESIWSAIKDLKAQRIGHGISSVQDEKLLTYLKTHKIPLEVCPTSNFFTRRFCKNYKDHPVRKLYDAGVNVTINTDDPSIFGVELVEEYARLFENKVFSEKELLHLIKNNLYATFLSNDVKDMLWNNIEKELALK